MPDETNTRRRRFLEFRPVSLDLGDVIVQIVAIALGVVLGFGVTAWTERVRQRALFHDTVGTIVNELKSNQAGLRTVMQEHAKLELDTVKTLTAAHQTLSLDQARGMLRKRKFSQNIPLAIAWQIAQADQGLALLPFDDRYNLAWVYQLQTVYYDAEQRFLNSLLTFHDVPGGNYFIEMAGLGNQLSAVVSAEQQLDDAYTKAIKESQKNIYR
jgi:hypothetical protein